MSNDQSSVTADQGNLAERAAILFDEVNVGSLTLKNRVVMAPMTRSFSPNGIPGENVARYYSRRAKGGVGLIITEGTWVPHPSASNDANVPKFYGEEALAGWKRVVDEVHAAGARIMPQIWHVGQVASPAGNTGEVDQIGPSGMAGALGKPAELKGKPATQKEIDEICEAFAVAAENAQRLGFDGVELHGAHGYYLDQFFWDVTNLRDDRYGGKTVTERTTVATEIIREIRRRIGPSFPISLRISQWKQQDYGAKLADTPQELESFLSPLADAGVDIFHCSQRRFWEGEFGSDMNLAGWAKKLSGKPSITVGSVTLKRDFISAPSETSEDSNLPRMLDFLERGDFDLVAIGRTLITDPDWPTKIKDGSEDEVLPFSLESLGSLD